MRLNGDEIKTPDLNVHQLNDPYHIVLPVYVWIAIGHCLQTIEGASVFAPSMNMLISKINDIIFTKSFQKSEQARWEQDRTERIQGHPLVQALGQLPGVQLFDVPEPDEFGDSDDDKE